MKISRVTGTTGEVLQVFIQDSSSTTGAGLTGLTNSSSGLTAYYMRNDQSTATVITLVGMTAGTFSSGGFAVMDGTNMPGFYNFCPPNAAFTSGRSVAMLLKGATNMAPLPIEIELTAVNNQDAAAFGMSRVDTTVSSRAATAGTISAVAVVNDKTGYALTSGERASIASALWQDITAGDFTVANSIGKSIMNGVSLGTGLTVNDLTTKTGFALTAAYDPAKTASQAGDAMTLTVAYNFAKGTSAMAESYAANTVTPTPIQAIYAIHQILMSFAITGTANSVKKLDQSTEAFQQTLTDAANPTGGLRS